MAITRKQQTVKVRAGNTDLEVEYSDAFLEKVRAKLGKTELTEHEIAEALLLMLQESFTKLGEEKNIDLT